MRWRPRPVCRKLNRNGAIPEPNPARGAAPDAAPVQGAGLRPARAVGARIGFGPAHARLYDRQYLAAHRGLLVAHVRRQRACRRFTTRWTASGWAASSAPRRWAPCPSAFPSCSPWWRSSWGSPWPPRPWSRSTAAHGKTRLVRRTVANSLILIVILGAVSTVVGVLLPGRHLAADADAAGDPGTRRGVPGHHFPGTDSHVPLQRAELGAPGPGRFADAAAVLGVRDGAQHRSGPHLHHRRGADPGHGHPRRGLGHAYRPDGRRRSWPSATSCGTPT